MTENSCYNEVDPNKIGVKVELNNSLAVYENKLVNAARNKGVHEFIDTIFVIGILTFVNRFTNLI